MKISLLGFVICFALSYCTNQSNSAKNSEGNSTIELTDSFVYHFQILDSVVRQNPSDTLYKCCMASIDFMEEKTEIEPSSPDGFSGRLFFTKRDWEKWHDWYNQNKRK